MFNAAAFSLVKIKAIKRLTMFKGKSPHVRLKKNKGKVSDKGEIIFTLMKSK